MVLPVHLRVLWFEARPLQTSLTAVLSGALDGHHGRSFPYKTEDEYNAAIVDACVKHGVEVVGITDHFRIATARSLADALAMYGVHVFLGFEASSSEGVHLLCLFPDSTPDQELARAIGACGLGDHDADSPQSDKTCEQLLQLIPKMGGIAIAAHACSAGGLLLTLKGQARARVWTKRRGDLLDHSMLKCAHTEQ